MKIEIIYEDNDIIVCRKPHGVATQTKRLGQQDMVSLLMNHRARKGEETYIGVVHRLDQPVEGIMVFAKNKKAAASLSRQVAERTIGKHYYAVVWTDEKALPEADTLVDYMLTDKKNNVSSIISETSKEAKRAELEYSIRTQYPDRALVDITLHTGRQHQIRLQFSSRGYPLLGDAKYGREQDGYRRIALCSYGLEFVHPSTGKEMKWELAWNAAAFVEIADAGK